jgi:nucleotide-binding universal stress UspA family protein
VFPIRTILQPTDFSPPAEAAFRLACSLARDHGSRLVVLHVLPLPVAFSDVAAMNLEPVRYRAELFAKLRRLRPDGPSPPVEHDLVEGDPAAEVLRVAGELVVRHTQSDG